MRSSTQQERAEPPREKAMDFEDLLKAVGGYGKYQQRLVLFFLVPISMTVPFLLMNSIFMLSAPNHWCHEPALSSARDLTLEDQITLVAPPNTNQEIQSSHDRCHMYNLNYSDVLDELRATGLNASFYVKEYLSNATKVPCKNGWNYDKSLYKRTVVTDWDLVCEKDHLPSLVFAMGTVGSAVGTPIFGAVSDKFGRKLSFFLASIVGVVSGVLTVLVPNLTGLIVVKAITGTLLPSVFQLPYLILVEIVSPEMRTRVNGVACLLWTVALALMPLVAWLTADWVSFGWVCAAAAFPYVPYYWILPESPRWLVSQRRFDEANDVFQKVAKVNGKDISNLDMVTLLKKCSHQDEAVDHRVSPKEFLKNTTLLRRAFFIIVIWTADAVTYYGFHLNVSALYGNEFLSFFLLALVEFPSYFAAWFMMETKLGRRWSNVMFLALATVVCLLPVMAQKGSKIFTTIASLLGTFAMSASFMVMYQQAAEVFPTTLRASGMGIAGTIALSTSSATPYIIYLGTYGLHIPYTVMCLFCLGAGVCSLFLPETLNENLPQTVDDGENFGKDKAFFSFANTKKISASDKVESLPVELQLQSVGDQNSHKRNLDNEN